MRLGHLSDLHVSDRARYPRNGHATRDCDRHQSRLAQKVLEEFEASGVEHLVVTGDLTLTGEATEFEKAGKMLRKWSESGRLTVVPGNHDVWSSDSVRTSRFLRMMGHDGKGMKRPEATYPLAVLASPDVAIVALDSTQHGEDPLTTPGLIGTAQLQSCRELVREHASEGRAVLLALHHHLLLPRERVPSDAMVARMALQDADKLIRLVADLRVAGVLHGHRHCAFRVDVPGAGGPTPVLCAGSASKVSDEPIRRARGYIYEVDRGGLRSVRTVVAPRA